MAKKRELDHKQEKKISLFDFVNDLSSTKKYIYCEDTDGVYNQFMINKAFSQHMDTILLASEMNRRSGLTNEMHHDFLFYSINRGKRYGKWAKKVEDNPELVKHVQNSYNIGSERAIEYIHMMSDQDITQIEATLSKGGKQ